MSLATNITDLATRVATEAKALRTLINGNAADLSGLATTAKGNLVLAINELVGAIAGASGIDDGTIGTTTSWSSQKTSDEIDAAIAAIVFPELTDLINDATTATTTVWSSTKTSGEITAAVGAIVLPVLTDLIDDETPSTSTVWSSTNTATAIQAAVDALVGSAPGALDTIQELAAALGSADAVANLTAAVGNRVRYDAAQTLTAPQQTQARTNIGAAAAADLGDPETDFVATFESGLV